MQIGMLFDRVAAEEKLLMQELDNRQLQVEMIDVRSLQLRMDDPHPWQRFDVIFDRSVSYSKALASLQVFASWQIPTVNTAAVAELCGNKLTTSMALIKHHIPTPAVAVAYSPESALAAIEQMGYPVVLKPIIGSWGRLLSKINDRDAAEAILEHKTTLGSYHHSIFYIQQYVQKKGGQDVRSFVVDGTTICAIGRISPHWITNTARGATAANFPLTEIVSQLSEAAAEAVGGGLLAIDLFQDPQGNWLVNEVNHSMEFRNSIQPTGVNIPAKMVEYLEKIGSGYLVN